MHLIKLRNDNFAFVRVVFRLIPLKMAAPLILRPTFRFERLFVRDNFSFFKISGPKLLLQRVKESYLVVGKKFSKTTTLPPIAQQGNQNIYHSHVASRNCARRRVYRHFSTKESLDCSRFVKRRACRRPYKISDDDRTREELEEEGGREEACCFT